MFSISTNPIESGLLSKQLMNSRAGALATFEGWVRDHNDGHSVTSLEYECFQALAEKEGSKIIEEAKERFDIVDASCCHRVGLLPVGELAVWVGSTAVHRADAFDACRFVIDEIKLRLPVWKKEHYKNGSSSWVNCSAHEHERHTNEQHAHAKTSTHASAPARVSTHGHSQSQSQTLKAAPTEDAASNEAPTESEYYSRQVVAKEIGKQGQMAMKNSRVLVIGAGGTGCSALQYLAGAGVGKIGVCDFDVVAISNLHRQPLYTTQDIGQSKAEVASKRLRAANPFIHIKIIQQKFESKNASQLLKGYDVVLDCTDNLSAKFCISDACRDSSKTLLQAAVHNFDGQLLMWRPIETSKQNETQNEKQNGDADADASSKAYEGQCYRCLWPSSDLLQSDGKDCVDSCAESGVLGAVPGLLGIMIAIETIKLLVGIPSPLTDHVLLFDLMSCSTTKVKVRRNQSCPRCADGEKNTQDNKENQEDQEPEFELHWSVLRLRSPRDLVYVDIRSEKERKADQVTPSKLKGRTVLEWPLDQLNLDALQLDKNLTYLLFCQRGKRSNSLVHKLRVLGHRNVFSLSQGVESFSSQKNEHAKV